MKRLAILFLVLVISIVLFIANYRNQESHNEEIRRLRNQNERLYEQQRILSKQIQKVGDTKIEVKVAKFRERQLDSVSSRYILSSKEMIPRVCISVNNRISEIRKLEAATTTERVAEEVEECPALVRNFQGTYVVDVVKARGRGWGENDYFDFTIQE